VENTTEYIWWNDQPFVVIRHNQLHTINRQSNSNDSFAILLICIEINVNQFATQFYVYWDGMSNKFEFIEISNDASAIMPMINETTNIVFYADAYNYLYEYMRLQDFSKRVQTTAVDGLTLAFELTSLFHSYNSVGMTSNFVGIAFPRKSPSAL
jgi:hypothetical protein